KGPSLDRCHFYCDFLRRLLRTCLDGLQPDRYFGTLVTYLALVELFLKVFLSPDGRGKLSARLLALQTGGSAADRLLVDTDLDLIQPMLRHSLEAIKLSAVNILVFC